MKTTVKSKLEQQFDVGDYVLFEERICLVVASPNTYDPRKVYLVTIYPKGESSYVGQKIETSPTLIKHFKGTIEIEVT